MNTTRTKANKVIISLVSVLLISCLVSLSVISASAANYVDGTTHMNFVQLPFPNPDSFGGDVVGGCVFYDDVNNRYEMWVFQCDSDPTSSTTNSIFNRDMIEFMYYSGDGSLDLSLYNSSNDFDLSITRYRFWFYPTAYSFSSQSAYKLLNVGERFTHSLPSGSSVLPSSIYFFGDVVNGLDGNLPTRNYSYSFNNDISPYVISEILKENEEIKLYCVEILEALGGGDDYVSPETTTNQTANDYGQAEQELMTNQFQKVEDIANVLPLVDSLQNKSAFQFLSSQIEFLVGAGDYDSTTYPSMNKIYGVVIFVLSIGFVSFAIGLVNRRKE